MRMLLQWAQQQQPAVAQGRQMRLLARVLEENFQQPQGQPQAGPETALVLHPQPAGAVKNPHDPQACWCTKGSDHQKDWIGYKVQVAETVPERLAAQREKGEPTEALITAIETQPATGSEEAGMQQVLAEQQKSGLQTPPELFVDSGYVSAQAMQEARQAGWELVGPAQEPTHRGNLLKSDADGKGVPIATTGTTIQQYGAMALESGKSGEKIRVFIMLGSERPAIT
jgi:hypothetical protein